MIQKSTSHETASQRPFALRSPDYYPAEQPKSFRDQSLILLLFVLLAAIVAFGIVLVMNH